MLKFAVIAVALLPRVASGETIRFEADSEIHDNIQAAGRHTPTPRKKVFFKTQAEAADSNSLSKVSEKPPKEDNSDQQLNCAKVKRSLRCAHKI
jgi:hypothetical protein